MASNFRDAESRNLEATSEALPALDLALKATDVLADVLRGVTIPAVEQEAPPASYYARSATFLLCVIGVRTARACVLVVTAGYWPEAHALKRRLSEVHARAEAIANDTSGDHARRWLEGKGPSTPHKIVKKWGSTDLWSIYGWGAHADPASVLQWLSEPVGEIENGIRILPEHDQRLSNAELVECAMECRDLAMAAAVSLATTRSELDTNRRAIHAALDNEIEAMRNRYYAAPETERSRTQQRLEPAQELFAAVAASRRDGDALDLDWSGNGSRGRRAIRCRPRGPRGSSPEPPLACRPGSCSPAEPGQ